jgi:hypothetical protein
MIAPYLFIVDQPLTAADMDAIAPAGSPPVSSK